MKHSEYDSIYEQIKQASQSNQLVVFIGAGMSNNFGFPTWNGLVEEMYQELTGKKAPERKIFSSDELLQIPQALRNKDKSAFERILKECFGVQRIADSENAMLDEIMKLKPKHIITTNFDSLIEKYLLDKEEALCKSHSAKEGYSKLVNNYVPYHYMPVMKDGDMVSADANHLFLKIHGDVQNMDSLVLCEDDYLEYSDSHILMENFIKSLLINHTFLFVGYGVGDTNLKMIMKWVDNIVSRQNADESKRKKHILLYAENKAMDELQRSYLEQKQIQVLEFCKLPKTYREQTITEFSDDRGKHLLAILRAIVPFEKNTKIDDEKLKELFSYFGNRKAIHVWEIAAYIGSKKYEIAKAGTQLRLLKGSIGCNWMEAVMRTARSKDEGSLSEEAREFIGKIGVDAYCYDRENKIQKIPYLYNGFMEDACITSNYTEIYGYAKNRKEYSFAEKACWALYVDNRKEAVKWLEKQWNSKSKMDLFEHLRFIHNAQQEYKLEKKYNVDFGTLWARIPDDEKTHQSLMQEYMTGCKELYHEFGEVSDKLRLKCYAKTNTAWNTYEVARFTICRTAILDFAKALILNGFYVTGLWPCTYSHGDISDLMYSYADVILFLLSPECRRKQEWFRLCPWDIFVLIQLVEKEELEYLLDKYKIVRLQADDEVQEVLLRNCVNMLCFSESRIARKSAEGHLASKRMENCMLLMNLFDWDKDRAALLIDKMFCYLSKSVLLERDARTFSISSHILYSFLVKQYERGYKELVSPHAEALLKRLLGKFLKEDHLNRYSKVLEDNAEWYRDTGALSNLIDKEHNGISKKLIAQCWKCYRKWYQGAASRLLADIYPLASSRVQKEISQFAGSKIKGISTILLHSYMEKGIICYSDEIETELLERCRRFSELPDKQRKRIPGGSDEKPLTPILRLRLT